MRTLVVGMGEVGTALAEVLGSTYEVDTYDIADGPVLRASAVRYEFLNLCFPYSASFVNDARFYQDHWAYDFRLWPVLVVHSTVPVGTTRQLGRRAVHSPVHGVHPHLAAGLRTFPKYVGGMDGDEHAVDQVVRFLRAAGIPAEPVSSPEVSEASKLWLTTGYAWNILLCKEIKRYCDANGLPFEEVYGTVRDYNEGYAKLGRSEVAWPILAPTPGPLAGHCLRPNAALLDARVAQIVRDWSDGYADELPIGRE